MRNPADIECWLTDMDGVLVRENHEIPGASNLIERWVDTSHRFLVLTNNSIFTPRDLSARLQMSGLTIPEENIWTSALATARFLADQQPGARLFVIGEAGLTTALTSYVLGLSLEEQTHHNLTVADPATPPVEFEARFELGLDALLAGVPA